MTSSAPEQQQADPQIRPSFGAGRSLTMEAFRLDHRNNGSGLGAKRPPPTLAGYDCDFIEPPQKQFQSECPICLQILREPNIVDCCGHSFCSPCIGRIEMEGRCCPMCKEPVFTVIPNKGLKRALNEFHVHCPNRELGCEWVGELGYLDRHLNSDPHPESQLDGCQLALIECIHCWEGIRRDAIADHQLERCPQRPFSCEHCSEYDSTHEDVTLYHWPECRCFPLPCPNDCALSESGVQRQNLDLHVAEECPLTVVPCELRLAGCNATLRRADMANHLKEDAIAHISLLAVQNQRLAMQLHETQELNARLKKTTEMLHVVPTTFTMHGFEEHRAKDSEWYSPPFYTHAGGYKMSLRIDARGRGRAKDTHVSVFACLVRGDYDSCLAWPFCGTITYELLNQLPGDKGHHTKTTEYDTMTSLRSAGRVVAGERSGGWGKVKFLPHSELGYNRTKRRQYLKDDCLVLRIVSVEL